MKQVMQDYWSGHLRLEEVPDFMPQPGMVLVKNSFSAISAGTERSKVNLAQKSLVGMARQRPDDVRTVLNNVKQEGVMATINKVVDRLQVPISLGYSSAGYVIDSKEFPLDTPVACVGEGYACHAEIVSVPIGFVVPVPAEVPLDQACYSGVGAIAIQGLRQAEPQLGEAVGVIGLGFIGQMLVQALKANGNRVIGFDPDPERVKMAFSFGIDAGLSGSDLKEVQNACQSFNHGVGLDAVIITASSADSGPIEWAGVLCREKGRVVVLGALPIHVPRKEYYEKELTLKLSRAFGAGSYDPSYIHGKDYPIGYVRWTVRRNMEAFLSLIKQGRMDMKALTTHRFPFANAPEAYELLNNPNEKPLGILFEYPATFPVPIRRIELPRVLQAQAKPGGRLGFIGMGNFTQTYLMPRLKNLKEISFEGVATRRGMTSSHAAKKFKFRYCAADAEEILMDDRIDTVFVTTRHNLHADMVCRALRQKKNVYVEKPLALSIPELEEIKKTMDETGGWLMAGFNRRFAPDVIEIKKRLTETARPFNLHIRVNAGPLPSGHWLASEDEGGGRLRGEGCHFVDLVQFLVDQTPVSVKTQSTPNMESDFQIDIRYEDGSVASVHYLTRSDPTFPRERLEIFGGGFSACVEDFTGFLWCSNLKSVKKKRFFKDLGYRNAMQAFSEAVLTGKPSPTPFHQIYLSSFITLKAHESLLSGKEIKFK